MKAIPLEESLRLNGDFGAAEEVKKLRFKASVGDKALMAMAAMYLLDAMREMLNQIPTVDERLSSNITTMSETLRSERNRMLDYTDAHQPSNAD